MLLLLIPYVLIGLVWAYFVHKYVAITNMIQSLFLILLWPLHVLIFLIALLTL